MNAIRENYFIASPVQEESKKVDDHPRVDILLHRNSTVARRVTNDTSEHYGNP